EAVKWFKRAAKRGNIEARGRIHTHSSIDKNSKGDHNRKTVKKYRFLLILVLVLLIVPLFYFFIENVVPSRSEPDNADEFINRSRKRHIKHSASSLYESYKDKQVGECFDFGLYPQGSRGRVRPISWLVLRRDKDDLLVISEYALNARAYNEDLEPITWKDCTLRRWLNSEFFNNAFNDKEKAQIKLTTLDNGTGPSTKDHIFLLSIDEIKNLFANDKERRAKPTDFAVSNGAYLYEGFAWYWLRSRGNDDDNNAACVYINGSVFEHGFDVYTEIGSVRPAFRISLKLNENNHTGHR
ncbi:hypothetical protein IJT10_07665, partial [bacterium]|nr:hypothetical protein [bacterium]